MNEPLTITTERVDDIPLLLAQMQRMGLARLLDAHFPTHGNREGLSLGMVTTIWLAHVLSQADHRMNRVQSWAERRLETLRGCSEASLEVRDLGDDRLADVLRHLSDDERWRAFEQELTGQLVRVYDLQANCVRLDSTTASSYGAVNEDGLLQLGHSKDHRPDLPQLKVMLATLDPLGLPLATEVLSGERADDPLYLPAIARVRSEAAARAAETALRARLGQAQTAVTDLVVRRQGKPVLADRAAFEQAVTETMAHFRVEGLLAVTVSEQVTEQPVRAYRNRPATVRTQHQFSISSEVEPEALASAIEQLGWRVYATNQAADRLSLVQAVEAYRDEYLVERNFGRLKGHPLSLSPMYVERDDHATGLVRLLSIALRVLTLLEFVVRRQLAKPGTPLAGLYAGNPKRATTHPTTERLLEAFQEIFLTILLEPHQTQRHITALSALQQRVLALLEFSPTIYSKLCEDSLEPP